MQTPISHTLGKRETFLFFLYPSNNYLFIYFFWVTVRLRLLLET